jgi:Ca2+-binding EF-hand superfamily protein
MHARLMLGLVLAVGGIAVLSPAVMAKDIKVDAALMKMLDPDNEGTVSLAEAKAAGAAEFTKLDTDKDGTLDMKELSGRVSEADFKAADPDGDGTLSNDEYAALIEKMFKAADPDNDGTLDKAELESAAGQKLLALIS